MYVVRIIEFPVEGRLKKFVAKWRKIYRYMLASGSI